MIRIDDLIVRIPGMEEEEAKRLVAEITERLAETLPHAAASGHIPDLELVLTTTGDYSQHRMAELITQGIINKINLVTI